MELKIHMGTPKGRESICKNCSFCQHMRGSENQEVIICGYGRNFEITFPVLSCSNFEDDRLPSLRNMEKIAWHVETRARGKWGFADESERVISITPPKDPKYDIPDGVQEGRGQS